MGEKILVGPITKGLRNDVTPFNIDNDSFPTLINAYQWRGRIKRKRGTSPLARLQRTINTSSIQTDGSGDYSGNILTGLEADSSVVLNSISTGSDLFTDPLNNGVLTGSSGGSGTINYATGALTLTGATPSTNIQFNYYPALPVMGLLDLVLDSTSPIGMLAFDTVYSYQIANNSPFLVNDVSYYNNPSTGSYSAYVAKPAWTPVTWNGEDYQQFGSFNYQGAFWETNGITLPFSITNIGMQFAPASTITFSAVTATTLTVVITNCPLIIGDFVFVNEWTAATAANARSLNFQSGYVTACAPNTTPLAVKTLTITFPNATIAADTYTPGIIQYLTNRSDVTKDCIRFYNGSPTNPSQPVTFNNGVGWTNFMPPLSSSIFSIADLPQAQYYLVGCSIISVFKDRLIFIGAVVQTSTGNPIYLQDTVVFSQNGTPYYTASFAASASSPPGPSTTYFPILVPVNQTAAPTAFWEDQTGLGGYITAGFQSAINTASANEDVLIMGFGNRQARFAYTGNDILPFQFFVINSELGSGSTHSAINLDRGIITMGTRGFILTSQIESKRIDLNIPDQIFEIDLLNNGSQRICAQRDFINEWIYFSYNTNNTSQNTTPPVYPTQTLQYNYREETWALFNETYTTYGTFRQTNGITWATVGFRYPTWDQWNVPWNSSQSTALQPMVIGGNTEGFVVFRGISTSEAPSLFIKSVSVTSGTVTLTCPNHCLNAGDYITIQGCQGTIGTVLNGKIFSVQVPSNDTLVLNPQVVSGSYTYNGLGTVTRMYIPFIASKAFPVAWSFGRKTRLGPQMYLLTNSSTGQVTLYIYLSQNYANIPGENAYNFGPIVPDDDVENNTLIYSTILYTCPESTNLGLTPSNTNLQMLAVPGSTAGQGGTSPSQQIWHRVNTSLIGDTVQIAITMSDAQMRDADFNNQFAEIELHAMSFDVSPSSLLA